MGLPNDKKLLDTFYIVVCYVLLVMLFLHSLHEQVLIQPKNDSGHRFWARKVCPNSTNF